MAGPDDAAAAEPLVPVKVTLRPGLAEETAAPLPDDLPRVKVTREVDTGMSEETIRRGVEEFKPRPTDILCATFAKTGTTLVTWICHQLRTGGHVDFEDIYQVAPWVLMAWDIGQDPNVDGSEFFPRVFKSHLRLGSVYPGCKYLVTLRDPAKTSISFYNFLSAKGIPSVTERNLSQFITETSFVKGTDNKMRGSLWDYYKEYWIARDCPSVLVVVYEDLVKDMPAQIRLIADFMGVEPTEELVERVASMSTKEFMASHESKMNESWVHKRAIELGRSPDNASMWTPAKRIVLDKHKQELDESATQFLDEQWQETITPVSGLKSYKEFAGFFSKRNAKKIEEITARMGAPALPTSSPAGAN